MFCNTRELKHPNLGHCDLDLNLPWTKNFTEPSFFAVIQDAFQTYLSIFSGSPFQTAFSLIWLILIVTYTITKRVDRREDELVNALRLRTLSNKQVLWENRFRAFYYPLFFGVFLSFGPASYYFVKNYTSMSNFNTSIMVLSFSLVSFGIFLFPFLGAFVFKYLNFSRMSSTEFVHKKLMLKLSEESTFLDKEESLFLEFKSTFQTSYPNEPEKHTTDTGEVFYTIGSKRKFKSLKEVEKLLQSMTLEAIVGFLNASGGELVIGINEKDNVKKVVGIECEGFASEDEYQRHVIQHINNRIGKNFMGDYIDTYFQKINGKAVFVIKVKPFIPQKGQIPVLLDGKDCFKRTGPRTDIISQGEEFAKFVVYRGMLDGKR